MSIPLVQNNEKDSINTSIIAIKRNIERINMLLGLSNSEEIDTSKFATKDELQQAVTDLQPVDEVAVDNMHSVTSNAVFNAINVCFPIVPTSNFAYIIKKNTIARYTGSAGKTVVVIFAVYKHNFGFSVQISCGSSDPTVQQMSGEGRESFQTVTQNSTPVAINEFYNYYRVSFQVSSNSNYVGIGTDADIGISDYHYE